MSRFPALGRWPGVLAVATGAAVAGIGAAALAGWATDRPWLLRTPGLVIAVGAAVFVAVLVLVVSGTVRVLNDAAGHQHDLLQALAAERDFTATLLQSLKEGIVVFDRDLRVIDVNACWCQLVGLPREELIGRLPPYTWQPDGEINPLPFGSLTGESDHRVRRPDGTLIPVHVALSPVLDPAGQPRAYVASFVDITERKRTEEALAGHAAELEGANDNLTRINRELAEAAEFKGDLMSMVSHEVSQPLSSVASLSELLAADWTDLPDDTRQDLAKKIDRNTRRLAAMIKDMLLLFRLDAGIVSARRAAVPIGEVVEGLSESLTDTTGIAGQIEPELCALVDRGHLWQILNNLVDNAIRYGEPPIEITSVPTDGAVLITVRDHGPGIAPEFVPHLFDRFTRSHTGVRAKGSGLGLFIVRHLVEVNSGTIWYEAAPSGGAQFVIRLELAAAPVPAA